MILTHKGKATASNASAAPAALDTKHLSIQIKYMFKPKGAVDLFKLKIKSKLKFVDFIKL